MPKCHRLEWGPKQHAGCGHRRVGTAWRQGRPDRSGTEPVAVANPLGGGSDVMKSPRSTTRRNTKSRPRDGGSEGPNRTCRMRPRSLGSLVASTRPLASRGDSRKNVMLNAVRTHGGYLLKRGRSRRKPVGPYPVKKESRHLARGRFGDRTRQTETYTWTVIDLAPG